MRGGGSISARGFLLLPISEMGFSVRVHKRLMMGGFKTGRDLAEASEADLKNIRGFGRASLNQVKETMARGGVHVEFDPAAIKELVGNRKPSGLARFRLIQVSITKRLLTKLETESRHTGKELPQIIESRLEHSYSLKNLDRRVDILECVLVDYDRVVKGAFSDIKVLLMHLIEKL